MLHFSCLCGVLVLVCYPGVCVFPFFYDNAVCVFVVLSFFACVVCCERLLWAHGLLGWWHLYDFVHEGNIGM